MAYRRRNQTFVNSIANDSPMHTVNTVRSRKRHFSEQSSLRESPQRACKEQKVSHPSRSLPAAFWDNLSEVHLTRNALKELDRRNTQRVPRQTQTSKPLTRAALAKWKEENWLVIQPAGQYLDNCTPQRLEEIQEFASSGPDLSDLRGYRKPASPLYPAMNSGKSKYRVQRRGLNISRDASTSRASSTSRSTSRSTRLSKPTTTTTRSSGPYDRDFQQHLIDHGIYPYRYRFPDGRVPEKPKNWEQILEQLARPRASLSPSRFSEDTFERFIQADADASKEKQVTESVIPFIEGNVADSKCVAGGIPFGNLDHLTDGTLVPGNPDRYYGARPEQLNRKIRNEIGGQITPSTQHDLPIVPNLFLAAKGPDGSAAVAKRQACYDGALGARGIHSLQEYGSQEPNFDNNAYTISSIYHDGTLKMFTSHLSRSGPADSPEFFMTQIKGWAMTSDVDAFREGTTWYRNSRDWTKEQRDEAIRKANERATYDVEQAVDASFSTVCEISNDESAESFSQQSQFSFSRTPAAESFNMTESSVDALRSVRSSGKHSEKSKRS